MTPTIVITLDGGVIQDVSVSHQVNVVILDRDVEGADNEDLTMVTDNPAWASHHWGECMPSREQTDFITRVLKDIEADVRPND